MFPDGFAFYKDNLLNPVERLPKCRPKVDPQKKSSSHLASDWQQAHGQSVELGFGSGLMQINLSWIILISQTSFFIFVLPSGPKPPFSASVNFLSFCIYLTCNVLMPLDMLASSAWNASNDRCSNRFNFHAERRLPARMFGSSIEASCLFQLAPGCGTLLLWPPPFSCHSNPCFVL